MAARRKLTDADRLALSIARAIRRSKCATVDVVNALIAVAAGRAVTDRTHDSCTDFEDAAHSAYHVASRAAILRTRGDRFVN